VAVIIYENLITGLSHLLGRRRFGAEKFMSDTQIEPIKKMVSRSKISIVAFIFALMPIINFALYIFINNYLFSIIGPFSLSAFIAGVLFFSPYVFEIIAFCVGYISYKRYKDELSVVVMVLSIFVILEWTYLLYILYRQAN
jgi:hypothetical protein